jgi:hypothetical protein
MKAFIVFFSFCDYVILYICSLCLNFFSPTCLKVKWQFTVVNWFFTFACRQIQSLRWPTFLKPRTSKAGFKQVKIMKEFVWMNIIFFIFNKDLLVNTYGLFIFIVYILTWNSVLGNNNIKSEKKKWKHLLCFFENKQTISVH